MKITKNRLSMFMRTRCEKQLFLSLHDGKELQNQLPKPAKRPGIGVLSVTGKHLETARNEQIIRLFGPDNVTFKAKRTNATSFPDIALSAILPVRTQPYIAIQPRFSIKGIAREMLRRLGFEKDKIDLIPGFSEFIPDVLLFRTAASSDRQVSPEGAIAPLSPELVGQPMVSILDIKHAGEANPSYCAEIALYAIALSNWVAHEGLSLSVSADAYLWTRSHQADSRLDQAENEGVADPDELIEALLADCDNANLKYYLPAVRSFFEEIVRVRRKVEVAPDAWRSLEWHVGNRCSACDWLAARGKTPHDASLGPFADGRVAETCSTPGTAAFQRLALDEKSCARRRDGFHHGLLGDERHLSKADKVIVRAAPKDYCMPSSQAGEGHLSLIPGITRGATSVLERENITTAQGLAEVTDVTLLQGHTSLKRDAHNLPLRAKTILESNDPIILDGVIAAIAAPPELSIYVSVNFDSSAGLLTGLAVGADITGFRKGERPIQVLPLAYVVEEKTVNSERLALDAFLTSIADCIDRAEEFVGKVPKGQLHFWERRQFTELCNAIGRHLGYVLNLAERRARALAWLFAPENLLTNPKSLAASTVAVVDQVVERLVISGSPYVRTLFGTSSVYYDFHPVQETDSFYREYLSNSIPRERIYEIWSGADQVKRGNTRLIHSHLTHRYSEVLEKQVKALRSVCGRLRRDFRGKFRAPAPRIPVSIPQGIRGVGFDSKLWIWWDRLNFCAEQLSSHMRLAVDGERLDLDQALKNSRNREFT